MAPSKILLLRVGMDLGFGGLGPLFADGRFEYVPIPETQGTSERSVLFTDLPARCGGSLARFVPGRHRSAAAHFDPEFTTCTYGDPTRYKSRQLRRLDPGDVLLLSAGLRPLKQGRGSRLYVIGYISVKHIHSEIPPEPWPPPHLEHLWRNAHFRRTRRDAGLVVVEGSTSASRLLELAVPLSDSQGNVIPEMQQQLGLTGSVRRAGTGRWIPTPRIASVARWLETLH